LKIGLSKTPSTVGFENKRNANLAKTKQVYNIAGDKSAEVNLVNDNNFDYIGEFFVGNPP
jgi:hypothetical protein